MLAVCLMCSFMVPAYAIGGWYIEPHYEVDGSWSVGIRNLFTYFFSGTTWIAMCPDVKATKEEFTLSETMAINPGTIGLSMSVDSFAKLMNDADPLWRDSYFVAYAKNIKRETRDSDYAFTSDSASGVIYQEIEEPSICLNGYKHMTLQEMLDTFGDCYNADEQLIRDAGAIDLNFFVKTTDGGQTGHNMYHVMLRVPLMETTEPEAATHVTLPADVPTNAWYTEAVQQACDMGYANIQENGLFYPNEQVSYKEVLQTLYNCFGQNSLTQYVSSRCFPNDEEWATLKTWAYTHALYTNYTDELMLDKPAQRWALVRDVYTLCGSPYGNIFEGQGKYEPWAEQWAQNTGIMHVVAGPITRAELMAVMQRALAYREVSAASLEYKIL